MELFPPTAPLESVAIDILAKLISISRGHKFILVIMDRITKLVKDVPMKAISAGEVGKLFVEH